MNTFIRKSYLKGPGMPLLNSGNWNPALHPRNSVGEFVYTDGGLHGRPSSGRGRAIPHPAAVSKTGPAIKVPPHPSTANIVDNMGYMHILAQEIGLYPATLRFYFLVKTNGLWDYKNQPTYGANPAYDPFGNFN
jgi:hypothetical protein